MMKFSKITAAALILVMLSACTWEEQQKTEEIFKPETDKLNRLGDSAEVRIDKITDSAKVRFNKIADSAEANLKRIGDSTKIRLRKLKDSVTDDAVDRISNRIKDAIKGKKDSLRTQ